MYQFITSSSELHNLIALIQDFGQYQYFIDPVAGLPRKQNRKRF